MQRIGPSRTGDETGFQEANAVFVFLSLMEKVFAVTAQLEEYVPPDRASRAAEVVSGLNAQTGRRLLSDDISPSNVNEGNGHSSDPGIIKILQRLADCVARGEHGVVIH